MKAVTFLKPAAIVAFVCAKRGCGEFHTTAAEARDLGCPWCGSKKFKRVAP